MTVYAAPIEEMRFVLHTLAGLDDIAALPGYEDISPDLVDAILEEAGKLGAEVLAPINRGGDIEGCVLENGVVRTPTGFKDAYRQFIDGGWNSMPFEPEYGGQGLPWLVATAVSEIWHSSNMAFGLCPMLTGGAVELLSTHGSEALKSIYLEKMVSGEWSGTMNLTEPQAGSDLARVRTKAVPDGNAYRVSGQKIYITYGEQDLTENIVHMVLARTPDAPEGIKGISLFVVPKFLPDADGRPGKRNDLRCVSIEHKLGINGSPTAVMAYGDDDGAIGYLVGEENRGIEYMFTMMNNARLAVGLEGIGIAERAYQQARAFAAERVQGREVGSSDKSPVTIMRHPDVRRMLLTMKAKTEAARAIAYFTAAELDRSRHLVDEGERAKAQALVDLLTPVVKAWSTDIGVEVADLNVQIHGGMGFVEETGAAQHLRDARIAPIYEGTNGIQALDLVGRKVGREGGVTVTDLITRMRDFIAAADGGTGDDDAARTVVTLSPAIDALEDATAWITATFADDPAGVAAGSVIYLDLLGTVVGGWLTARGAMAATAMRDRGGDNVNFIDSKLLTARFYADQVLSRCPALAEGVKTAAETVLRADVRHFLP